jgi:hypothetical protein
VVAGIGLGIVGAALIVPAVFVWTAGGGDSCRLWFVIRKK